jgi:hypothetical protein
MELLDRSNHDECRDRPGESLVERDEGVRLELRQGDVLGVERVGPTELVGDLPGNAPEDTVAERSNAQTSDVVQALLGVLPREFPSLTGLKAEGEGCATGGASLPSVGVT